MREKKVMACGAVMVERSRKKWRSEGAEARKGRRVRRQEIREGDELKK